VLKELIVYSVAAVCSHKCVCNFKQLQSLIAALNQKTILHIDRNLFDSNCNRI